MKPDPKKIAALLARNDLRFFLRHAFNEVNPATEFQHNWHLDLLCWSLMRTLPAPLNPTPNDPIRRLIINVPPRSLKSVICSVAFPAFLLGHFPHERILCASYSGRLSSKFASDTLKILRAPWYTALFPNTRLTKETEAKITTTRNGLRFATSVGGSVTGEGGNYLMADDLLNPQEAASQKERENANDWFDNTFYSRLDDKSRGVMIVIMQRLHEADLTGHLLAKNPDLPPALRWHHICLPAIGQRTETHQYYNQTRIFPQGDLLHPERDTLQTLEALRTALGSYGFAGQYLQQPAPEGGGLLQLDWFGRYPSHFTPTILSKATRIVQSWDTAQKATATSDYSACTTWAETPNGIYLIHAHSSKREYPDLLKFVPQHALQYGAHAVLIEDKSSGQSLLQDLRSQTNLPVIGCTPTKDKITRVATVSPLVESGRIHLPIQAPWLPPLEHEIMLFPNAAHDDLVDSLSQALEWFRGQTLRAPNIRIL